MPALFNVLVNFKEKEASTKARMRLPNIFMDNESCTIDWLTQRWSTG